MVTANSFSLSVIREEMGKHHVPDDFKVNMKLDAAPGEDLIKVLEDMRQEYEFITEKKHSDLTAWFKEQVKERCPNFSKVPFPKGSNVNASALGLVGSWLLWLRRWPVQQLYRVAKGHDVHEPKGTFQTLKTGLQAQCNRVTLISENAASGTVSSRKL